MTPVDSESDTSVSKSVLHSNLELPGAWAVTVMPGPAPYDSDGCRGPEGGDPVPAGPHLSQ